MCRAALACNAPPHSLGLTPHLPACRISNATTTRSWNELNRCCDVRKLRYTPRSHRRGGEAVGSPLVTRLVGRVELKIGRDHGRHAWSGYGKRWKKWDFPVTGATVDLVSPCPARPRCCASAECVLCARLPCRVFEVLGTVRRALEPPWVCARPWPRDVRR